MMLEADPQSEKCQGLGCAYRTSCGRYMRPSAGDAQKWGSWYAIAEDDCAAFEPIKVNGHGKKSA